ncbi:hypothetical protein [Nonomuraea angiospora]
MINATENTEAPATYIGPAAYLVAAHLLHPDEGPFLTLECPHPDVHDGCIPIGGRVKNVLRSRETFLDLDALVEEAITHDIKHARPDQRAIVEQLHEQEDLVGRYTVNADHDEWPFLVLNCPYGTPSALYCPDPKEDGECVMNLAPEGARGMQLGALLDRAAEHEAARTRAIGAEAVAELVGRLTSLRQTWANRQLAEIYDRETSDGASAFIASANADLLGRMIAELDRAVHGG